MRKKRDECLTTKLSFGFTLMLLIAVLYPIISEIWHASDITSKKLSLIFSLISSLGILVTIIVYFWQKWDAQKTNNAIIERKICAVRNQFTHQMKINNHIVMELKSLTSIILNVGKHIDIKYHLTNGYILVATKDNRFDFIFNNEYKPSAIININTENLESILKELTNLINDDALIELFSDFIIDAYDILYDSMLLSEKIVKGYEVGSLYSTADGLQKSCNSFMDKQKEIQSILFINTLH
ncbi:MULTISPECIES: hypothetical protein [Providencia]|uniref:hypothetical protein n=1 Tax=Providencia TaxID=586 RepID=UPI001B3793B8|nr:MULTISPECIES: hypothetical protein [Providencia]EJD6367796.1 hypothetical protein [Providencia rettgeri]EJD6581940.1 hypothetical protein [Providencia rettgeri]ELR5030519.1 hypothetical protein [Providencia rettgeri]ELR5159510.1 hypothetical protein [Providencia rettgeri]MBQ0361499.1 hypothetical protein [Providencia rettgeri]